MSYYQNTRESDHEEDRFMATIAVESARTSESGAVEFLEKYFDTESIVTITAVNTILGQTDDWRRRHNFFWYDPDSCSTTRAE
jgi:spore coat protein CotH